MRRPSILAVVMAMMPVSALATPILSGTYEMTTLDLCQEVLSVDASTKAITITDPGVNAVVTFATTFNPTNHTYSSSGTSVNMTALYAAFSDGSHKGVTTTKATATDSGAYSNTAATLTLKTFTYDVTYGALTGAGIATDFSGVLLNGKHCTFLIQAHRL